MAQDLICDGCGATLPKADDAGMMTCGSCGRITRDPAHRIPTSPTTPFAEPRAPIVVDLSGLDLSGAADTAVKTTKAGCGIGSVVMLIVLVVVGIIVFSVVRGVNDATKGISKAFSSAPSSNLFPDGDATWVLPGGEGSEVDVLTLVSDNQDDSRRKLVRLTMSEDGTEQRWISAAFAKDAYTVVVAYAGNDLWVGANDELRLLDLRTGKERWHTGLNDKVTTGCPGCFSVVEGKLVVRTDDAYLSGFGASSGEPLWTKRLGSVGARPSVASGRVIVVDQESGKDPLATTLDPASGRVVNASTIRCPATPDEPFDVELQTGAQIVGVPGSTDVAAVAGSGYSCAARWDPATGAVRWTDRGEGSASPTDNRTLVAGTDLVFATNEALVRIDLGSGRRTTLAPVPDVRAKPLAIVGRTVLGETETTRGTTKGGLAAWSLDDGRNLWATPLPQGAQLASDNAYNSSDALFDGQNRSVYVPPATPAGPAHVMTFEGEGRTYRTQTLDLATGALGTATPEEFPTRYGGDGTVSMTVVDSGPTRVVVTMDTLLEVIPVDGGAVVRWPS